MNRLSALLIRLGWTNQRWTAWFGRIQDASTGDYEKTDDLLSHDRQLLLIDTISSKR
jgi:hypothetical protein